MFMADMRGVRATADAASCSGCDALESFGPELAFRFTNFSEDGSYDCEVRMRPAGRAEGKLKTIKTIMNSQPDTT
jgi:hypothetical protein